MKNRRKKKLLFFSILLLSIGFAAVTTTLVLNGTLNILGDTESFASDVIFTRATTEDGGESSISEDGKTITFTSKELSKVNESTTLDFDITNKNRQYDAVATINCNTGVSDYADYITVVPNKTEYEVNAGETVNGNLTATLVKSYDQEEIADVAFTCTLNATAQERDSLGPKYSVVKKISGDGTKLGDELAIGDEHFYVLSNDGENIKMLAKYNLYVGGYVSLSGAPNYVPSYYIYEEYSGMQRMDMLGAIVDNGQPIETHFDGITAYSEVSTAYEGSLVEQYVNNYVNILKNNYNIDVSADILSKEEIEIIGNVTLNNGYSMKGNANIPEWIYSTTYWLKNDESRVWGIYIDGTINRGYSDTYYNNNTVYGVRPVITIATDLIN